MTFIGNNTISVGTTEEGPYELKLLMELPLYFHPSPDEEEDTYQFVYNRFKEEVVFSTVDDYMYVMFKVSNSTNNKTVINIYKLSGSRHDSLKMQIELD